MRKIFQFITFLFLSILTLPAEETPKADAPKVEDVKAEASKAEQPHAPAAKPKQKHKYIKPDIDDAYLNKRYFDKLAGEKAKIAIVFINLGLDEKLTQTILDVSPKQVTMALSPYRRLEPQQARQLKQQGHELLLVLPTESYQGSESGQDPLRVRRPLSVNKNIEIIEKVLSQNPSKITGLINDNFSPALKNLPVIKAISMVIKPKDLMLVNIEMPFDNIFRTFCRQEEIKHLQIDYAVVKMVTAEKLKALFNDIENLASKTGRASLVLSVNSVNVKEGIQWIQSLDTEKFQLITLSEFQKIA